MKNIKKRVFIYFMLFLCIIPSFPIFAAEMLPRLVDNADLLTDSEESALLGDLDEISERQQVDIVVVTVDSLEGASAMDYADDFFDYNGYGFGSERDGILLLISMEERDWYISTSGYGITAVTDAGLDYMSEKFVGYLSDGDYAEAFRAYAGMCDDFITQADTGEPYDVGNMPKNPFSIFIALAVSVGVGFVVALFAVTIMRWQLDSVSSQTAADSYIKSGSMQMTKSSDLFLYRHVDRRERPKESSSGSSRSSGGSRTHRSSSGRRHGGRGGKF